MRTPLLPLAVCALACSAYATQITESVYLPTDSPGFANEFGRALALSGNGTFAVGNPAGSGPVDSGYVELYEPNNFNKLARLQPNDSVLLDSFGSTLDLDGDLLVIGAINSNATAIDSGSAYLFDLSLGAFGEQVHQFVAEEPTATDRLGGSIAIEGHIVAVGAGGDDDNGTSSGAVYVYDAITGEQQLKLLPNDASMGDRFGASGLDIHNGLIAVGATQDDDNGPQSGSVYLFDAVSGLQLAKLTASDGATQDRFGRSIVMSDTKIVVGATNQGASGVPFEPFGAVYIFGLGSLQELAKLLPSEPEQVFGRSLAISGSNLAVGAPGLDSASDCVNQPEGAVYLFDLDSHQEFARYQAADQCPLMDEVVVRAGVSVELSPTQVLVGAPKNPLFGPAISSLVAFPLVQAPQIYCTAKQSSAGCNASLAFSGPTPLPSSGNMDASVDATDVQGQLTGLLLFSPNGPADLPFNGGTLCIQPPLKRGVAQSSTGTPQQCDGSFSTIINVGGTSPSSIDVGSGNTAWYQYWYRDPQNPEGSALSNAVEVDFR